MGSFLNKILNLDKKIQYQFDRILPRNLTLRYILGLALIGITTTAGHLVIQISLVKLTQDERMIRKIESQIANSETFYREIIYLQTINNDRVYRERIEELDREIFSLIRNHYQLAADLNQISLSLDDQLLLVKVQVQEAFELLEESYKRISNIKFMLDASSIQLTDPILIAFIRSENTYRDLLNNLNRAYEYDSQNALNFFKRIEFILLFLTLLVLVIEGLYVFRPAVQRVYSAIQLRTEFMSRMSHEIRNPMNSILGMAQLLAKTRVNSQQKNYLKILENSSQGLLEMLNNLLDYSSIESGKMRVESIRTDLYNVIEKSMDLLTVKVQEKNLELVLDIDFDVPLVIYSDPVRLQQIIVNLLSNAAKFTEQGHIKIKVSVTTTVLGQTLQISVEDSGIGIDQTKVESIFESFVQENSSVRRKYGGTGLGLAIAREIVSLMGGDISLETKKCVGSTFTISLPLKPFDEERTLEKYVPQKLNNKKFLLIDEHEQSSLMVKKLIEGQGGELDRKKSVATFDDVFLSIEKNKYEKILIDASTLGVRLESILEFFVAKKYPLEKICILFRYLHANYLFDLIGQIGVTQVFPKPIKPIEFLNYLSGLSVLIDKEMSHLDEIIDSDQRFKILIAEDSADNRMLLQLYLEKMPLDLYFAINGLKAIELYQQHRFDIVLMDIQMPEMDGSTAAQHIRKIEADQKLPAVPILAFSAHKPEEINYDPNSGIFNDFVVKPVSAQVVKAKISQYLKFQDTSSEVTPGMTSVLGAQVSQSKEKQNKSDIDLSDLIPAYIERRFEDVAQIESFAQDSNFQMIARIGHQIKGTAKSYGFEDLGLLAQELEKSANENNRDKIIMIAAEIKNRLSNYQKIHFH